MGCNHRTSWRKLYLPHMPEEYNCFVNQPPREVLWITPDRDPPTAVQTVLAGAVLGVVLHGAWMFYLLRRWGPRILPWPHYTDMLHTTVFVMPRTGWDVEPLTAGLAGIGLPGLMAAIGWLYFGMGGPFQPRNPVWQPILTTLLGVGFAGNAFLMLLLLCVED